MRILTVIGTRPQFIKHAVLSHLLRSKHEEILVHTGQHHDYRMNAIFFQELQITEPNINLGISGGTHGEMTGRMMVEIEHTILIEKPDLVLVYGDTNSTLAGALAASKLQIPIAHVEAGLRSFNRRMPEEINRIVTDHVSSFLFCPTENAKKLLLREGIVDNVYVVGDVMYDSVLTNLAHAKATINPETLFATHGFSVAKDTYAFATLHRSENTDDPKRLSAILTALSEIELPVLFPLHPRTRKAISALTTEISSNVYIIEPISYLETLFIAGNSRLILTDSGGLQKEALFLGIRCVTLRDETEWIETVELGANIIAGSQKNKILAAVKRSLMAGPLGEIKSNPFGDGNAAANIVSLLSS